MMNVLRRIALLFRSVKLTVVLLCLLALTCLIGAIITQSPFELGRGDVELSNIGKAARWYFRWHTIYRSPFFITLLSLLAINALACSLKSFRRPIRRKIGWIMTHASILVILVGVVVGQLTGDAGLMKLYRGQLRNTLTRDDETELELGFSVVLDEFTVEYYDTPTERLIVLGDETEQELPVIVGREYRLRDGSGSLKIVDHVSHGVMVARVADDEESELNPAIRVVVQKDERSASNWVFAAEARDTLFFESAISVRYIWCDTDERYSEALRNASSPVRDKLIVHIPGRETVEELPVELGKAFRIEGTDYRIEILRYFPHFRLDSTNGQPISVSDEPRNPAIEVKIDDGKRSVKRWVFSRFPDFWRMHPDANETEVELKYIRPAERVVTIADLDNRRTMLVQAAAEGPAEAETIRLGETIKLGENGWSITMVERVVRPKITRYVTRSADPNADPAIQVRVKNSETDAEDSVWLMANVPSETGGTRLLYSRRLAPKQYISTVRFIQDGQETKRRVVRVNAPLKYRGFTFYQSSYGDDGRVFAVLQVKTDPGAPIVYAGFVLLCVGLLYGFYVKPVLLKHGRTAIGARG